MMNSALDIPWHRYALIAELAKRLEGVSPQFGKTALQKIVYFLQEIYKLDCGYDFTLYSYGPFDSRLLGDLDQTEHFGCVTVQLSRSKMGGHEIRPTDKVESIHEKAAKFLEDQKTRDALDSLVKIYGNMTARDLELRATIVYVERDIRREDQQADKNEVCRLVKRIKSRFSRQEIERVVNELNDNGHIQLAT